MRRRFNDGRYWERVLSGELYERVTKYHKTIYPEVAQRHPGAASVTAHYLDGNNVMVAEVHYFSMPDGSVAPEMRPDPKLLFESGVLYHQEKEAKRADRLKIEMKCQKCGSPADDANPPELKATQKRSLVRIVCVSSECGYNDMWRAE